ncbi:MAG: DUF475 domain-containing protein [Desulfobacterales bacterium]|nr:DUF475 domain-containing protein [Desulfobacterales bacterium]
MDITTIAFTISGLVLFESITSIDNAIINAEVLTTMGQRARRWFLTWGILIAVVGVRGLLPWLIVWVMTPGLGPWQAFTATIVNDPAVLKAIESSAPVLLIGGGVFFIFLFFHWLFMEPKKFGLPGESFFLRQGAWFYAIVSTILMMVVWFALKKDSMLAFGAVVGSTSFFITHGFKRYAESEEERLLKGDSHLSDLSKILYLEVIDSTFSIDGVVGAFAFTLSVPLILLGNGIGAIVVRQLTVYNLDKIKKYVYLKNGAMYSVLVLGFVMLAHGYGIHVPEWVSPAATFLIVGYFLFLSWKQVRKDTKKAASL